MVSPTAWNSKNQVIAKHAFRVVSHFRSIAHASGTAMAIAPSIVLTAGHVIRDHWKIHEITELRQDTPPSFSMLVFADPPNDDQQFAVYRVTHFTVCGYTDLALMRVTPMSNAANRRPFDYVGVDLHPPKMGQNLGAFGYRRSEVECQTQGKLTSIQFDDEPWTAVGDVQEIYLQQRDSVLLNFPCFRLNSNFFSGMSGGPIINKSGNITGIVCASLDDGTEDVSGVSYGSTLWPLLRLPIPGDEKKRVMLDLAKEGNLAAVDWRAYESVS